MKLLNSDKIVDFIDKHSKAIDEDYEKTYTLDQIQEYLDAMPADYDVDSVVAEIENINTTWNCQECIHLETCDKIQMEKGNGGEHLDLCAEVVKVLSTDIVRKGGINE